MLVLEEQETPPEPHPEPEPARSSCCIECGRLLAAVLARLGSLHCHDCRTAGVTTVGAA